MAELAAKIAGTHGNVPIDELVEQMGVETFDKHLRSILNSKDCNCIK
jgi:hypothetical protein